MFFKKCILMVSLAVVTVLSVPNFASADVIDVLRGKTGSGGYGREITDGSSSTCTRIFDGTSIERVRFDLGLSYKTEKFYVNSNSNNGSNLVVKLLNSAGSVIKEFKRVSGYVDAQFSDVRYVVIEPESSSFAVNVCDFNLLANDGKLTDIKNLKDNPSSNEVSFNWTNPTEETFVSVKVYMDGKLLDTLDKKVTSYVAKGLKPNGTYDFKFTALDSKGIETKGVTKKVQTSLPLVDPPANVFLTPQNGSLIINWEPVKSPYLKGYNVYVDGKKVSNELLTSNKLILRNMENDKKYSVQISSVNLQGKEGNKSAAVIESPSKDATTIEYDLKPPLTGMEFLETCGTIVLWLSPFILIGIVVIWFKPLKDLIVKAVLDHKKKGEKK
ncbi:hypothetical protein COL68_23700 [Bacillus wiedmannii]|uniref:fibronectin type III domain-containing protein n=1 Tax=Bacillus wiedmannii TaxID=1890302 RepID=UPI000BF68E20|nr:fibronectin type III domain-containing protein [Bacillus wiedmannii]PFZ53535.1 hypothetical protein COL68_23700 [Bacillus wiedmannii]